MHADAATEPRGAAFLDGVARNRANFADSANVAQNQRLNGANTSANFARTLLGDETRDCVTAPPVANRAMFYGLLGRFAEHAARGTEVAPAAAMLAAMTWLSAGMGRNTCIEVGDSLHHVRLFGLHVGRSSRGGKGMAVGLLKRVIKALAKIPAAEGIQPQEHQGGLSSREGLALLIHDGYRDAKEDIPPIEDKRLWVHESEFANLLAQAARNGNTLSTALRDAWDGVSIKPATKSSRVWASRPHISLHACITPTELRDKIARGDLSNGFANRFLMIWAERAGVVPFPSRCPQNIVDELAEEFAAAIRCGLGDYPAGSTLRRLTLSSAARARYSIAYSEFSKPNPSGELISGLLQRRAPMALRMAGLFAITDLTLVIEAHHMDAAIAWMDFFAKSVALIFGPMVDVEFEAAKNDTAEQLHAFLADAREWKSRTSISRECFGGHLQKVELDRALEALTLERRIERDEVDTGGVRKQTRYRVHQGAPVFAKTSHQASHAQTLPTINDAQNSQSSPLEVEI